MSSPGITDAAPDDLSASSNMVFTTGAQQATVALPASKAAMLTLMETWPRAIDVEELCADRPRSRRRLHRLSRRSAPRFDGRSLRRGDVRDGAAAHRAAAVHEPRLGEAARASARRPIWRCSAIWSSTRITRHYDSTSPRCLVLRLLNGERSRSEIVENLLQRHQDGALLVEQEGQPVTTSGGREARGVDDG